MMVEMIFLKATEALPKIWDNNLAWPIKLVRIMILLFWDRTVIFGESGETIRFPKLGVIIF